MGSDRQQGTVVKWVNHKGMGFIKPEEGGKDIRVHHSDVQQESEDGFVTLKEGRDTNT
jgi:cold shock protein